MNLMEQKDVFEKTVAVYERAKLRFHGVEGFDVYNTSIPFSHEGKEYIFGRVERRSEWARSWVRLFTRTGEDDWSLVPGSMVYQLEDPYVAFFGETIVLGGTHVRYRQGKLDTYYGYFYRGERLDDLYYFTTGPDFMKDIRLVGLPGGEIGVFSRPRNEEVLKRYGSASVVGFTTIRSLDDLSDDVIENAPVIPGLFESGEWGGCNQCYALASGKIGVIGHRGCKKGDPAAGGQEIYLNVAFVFDPVRFSAGPMKIIGTRASYPQGPCKRPWQTDVAFTSGIVMRPDGKADLFSGIGDCEEGRAVIDDPFSEEGGILRG